MRKERELIMETRKSANIGARLDRLPNSGWHIKMWLVTAFALLVCWSNGIGGSVQNILLNELHWLEPGTKLLAMWGTTYTAGQLFGEVYACTGEPLGVSVCAKEQCTVLFLSPESIIKESSTLTARLLKITAMKNLRLNEKIQVITPRTIRERVMAYLSSLAKKSGSHIVTTNFDRQQLADFLCVDRSALSTELGKMHREGLIDLKGREFILPENCSCEM